MFKKLAIAALLPLTMVSAAAAPAPVELLRDRPAELRPQLMLVGTMHFANHGRDMHNNQVPDVLEPRRQKEMAAVVDALSKFNPTKVAVEWQVDRQAELDTRYNSFRAGTYTLSRSEIDQLGMRVAARLGHERIYAVDWNKMPPGQIPDFDFATWAANNGQQARLAALRNPARTRQVDAILRTSSVAEWLLQTNQPEELERKNRAYFDYAMLNDSVSYPGANWVANWYGRNLKIFANLVRLADKPGDRVLVIYGGGHIFPVRQFAEQSGAFTIASPLPLLGDASRP